MKILDKIKSIIIDLKIKKLLRKNDPTTAKGIVSYLSELEHLLQQQSKYINNDRWIVQIPNYIPTSFPAIRFLRRYAEKTGLSEIEIEKTTQEWRRMAFLDWINSLDNEK